jgi:hypothetical protein
MGMSDDRSKRLWRLRKLHDTVDAELRAVADDQIELKMFYNGELAYVRRLATRAEAISEAASKRAELEREGWNFHW